VRPSPPLCDTVRQGRCQSRDTVPATLVRLTRRALESGRRNLRRGDGRLFYACPRLCRDIRPAGLVTSVAIGPMRPYPPPQHHPEHCSTIPDAVGVRGDKTPPRRLLCTLRPPVSCTLESAYGRRLIGRFQHHHPRSRSWTDTGHAGTLRRKPDSPGRPSTPSHCPPCHHT
jgi:hypothetical protein